jgi:glycosyltransferase involved in cell wall biosynthesis
MRRGGPFAIAAFSSVDLSLPQGHALHLRGLLDALSDRGHSVSLVTPRPKGVAPATRFARLETRRPGWRALSLLSFEILGGLRLWAWCREKPPDVIYVRHDLYSFSSAIVARVLRVPLVVEVNASVTEELAIQGHRTAGRVAAVCERFTLGRAERILVLAPAHGEDLVRRLRIDPNRIRVVPIATRLPGRTDPAETRRERTVAPKTFVVGFAGNLSRIQGVDLLIAALRGVRAPDLELWVIGSGEEESRLRDQAGDDGRVRFFGGVSREESETLLAACQLLVAPYRRPDYDRVSAGGALSSKVLTYLAADRPVLISDIPSYRWLSEIGAGESVSLDAPAALSRAIEELHARWCASGRPLHDWPRVFPGPGRRFVEEGRTWDHAAARVEEIIKEMLDLRLDAIDSRGRRSRAPAP